MHVRPAGPRRPVLETRARSLGLRGVAFLGSLDEDGLRRAYGAAHAFLLPSLWEGLPPTLLEAWAARLPVVATPVGGIPEVAVDGENALLAPPGDAAELAERMRALLEEPELGRRLGAAGRALVEARFTWDRTVEGTLAVYEACLGSAP